MSLRASAFGKAMIARKLTHYRLLLEEEWRMCKPEVEG
jgi:hypothetical protein